MVIHGTHTDIRNRLRRAEGHLRTIVEMLETNRSCVDIAQQLHAVEKAISAAKRALIHDHLDHCLDEAVDTPRRNRRQAMVEFKEIAKYL